MTMKIGEMMEALNGLNGIKSKFENEQDLSLTPIERESLIEWVNGIAEFVKTVDIN